MMPRSRRAPAATLPSTPPTMAPTGVVGPGWGEGLGVIGPLEFCGPYM